MKKVIFLLSLIAFSWIGHAQVVVYADSNYIYKQLDSTPILGGLGSTVSTDAIQTSTSDSWGYVHDICYVFNVDSVEDVYGIAFTAMDHNTRTNQVPIEVMVTLYAKDSDTSINPVDSVVVDCTRFHKQFAYWCLNTRTNVIKYDTVPVYEALFSRRYRIDCDSIVIGYRPITTSAESPYNIWCTISHNYMNMDTLMQAFWLDLDSYSIFDRRFRLFPGPQYAIRCRECPQVNNAITEELTPYTTKVTWNKVDSAAHYRIEYGPAGFHYSTGTVIDSIFDTTYTLSTRPGESYDIYVNAYCDKMVQYGMPCMAVAYTPDTVVCPAPEGFGVSVGDGIAMLRWSEDSLAERFQLSYGPYDRDPESNTLQLCHETTVYLTEGLDTNIYYAAYVRAECHHQCYEHDTTLYSPWSGPLYFYTGTCMPDTTIRQGIGRCVGTDFTLTPNPARDRFTVTLPGDVQSAAMVLRDESGRERLSRQLATPATTISTKHLPRGLYFVTLTTPQGSSSQKLMIE